MKKKFLLLLITAAFNATQGAEKENVEKKMKEITSRRNNLVAQLDQSEELVKTMHPFERATKELELVTETLNFHLEMLTMISTTSTATSEALGIPTLGDYVPQIQPEIIKSIRTHHALVTFLHKDEETLTEEMRFLTEIAMAFGVWDIVSIATNGINPKNSVILKKLLCEVERIKDALNHELSTIKSIAAQKRPGIPTIDDYVFEKQPFLITLLTDHCHLLNFLYNGKVQIEEIRLSGEVAMAFGLSDIFLDPSPANIKISVLLRRLYHLS